MSLNPSSSGVTTRCSFTTSTVPVPVARRYCCGFRPRRRLGSWGGRQRCRSSNSKAAFLNFFVRVSKSARAFICPSRLFVAASKELPCFHNFFCGNNPFLPDRLASPLPLYSVPQWPFYRFYGFLRLHNPFFQDGIFYFLVFSAFG